MWHTFICTRVGTWVMPLVFFSVTLLTVVMKFTYITSIHPLQSWHISTKSSSSPPHFFPLLHAILCANHVKLCWSIADLHSLCVWAHHCLQNFILGLHPSGRQKDGSWGSLNQYCKEDEGKQPAVLLQLPPLCTDWCVVWHCHARRVLNSYSCLAQPFVTSLMSAHIAVNRLWHLSPRIILQQHIKLPLVFVITAVAGQPLWGLSAVSFSLLLKWRTQDLTELMSMAS